MFQHRQLPQPHVVTKQLPRLPLELAEEPQQTKQEIRDSLQQKKAQISPRKLKR